MKNNNGNGTAAPLGLLDEINARLAAITPEQFIAPEVVRPPSVQVVTQANEQLKRLYTLLSHLTDECNALAKTGIRESMDALRQLLSGDLAVAARELQTEGSEMQQERIKMRESQARFERLRRQHDIVYKVFWADVRAMHPDLQQGESVCLYSDWSLCLDEEDDDIAEGGLLASLLPGLHEALRTGRAD